HKADGTEAVEPAVSCLLHHLGEALLLNQFGQCRACWCNALGVGPVADKNYIALSFHGGGGLGGNAIACRLFGDGGNKGSASLGGVFLDVVGIHWVSFKYCWPLAVKRYFCRRLLGASGRVISMKLACSAGAK